MSLRGVSDEAISLHGQEIASQSLAMTRSGKWGRYSGYDPLLDALKTQANFWIQPLLYETILKQMGELP